MFAALPATAEPVARARLLDVNRLVVARAGAVNVVAAKSSPTTDVPMLLVPGVNVRGTKSHLIAGVRMNVKSLAVVLRN
jgi:hypothetical protein